MNGETLSTLYRRSGLRRLLQTVGLHGVVRDIYASLVTGRTHTLEIGGFSADFYLPDRYALFRLRSQQEEAMLLPFLEEVREGDVVMDVGADMGVYTYLAAAAGAGTVYGFEPAPPRFEELTANRAVNDAQNVELFDIALTDENTTMELPSGHPSDDEVFEAEGSRLDALVEEKGIQRPDVVKVDVEGQELRVLEGMEDILDDVRTLFVEVHPEYMAEYDDEKEELRRFLQGRGFDISLVGEERQPTPQLYWRAEKGGGA